MIKSLLEKGATSQLTFKRPDGSSTKSKFVLMDRDKGTLTVQ
jgi:DNA topoisomerase-3